MLGELDIRSEPPGAAIYLDTEETGEVTPAVLGDVAPGAHRVRMVLDGHQPFEQSVEVAAGDISGVTATLTRASATLVVDSRPRGAVVYLDGQLTGKKTRCTLDDLAQGEHRLRLTRSGYRETRVTVQLEPGASLERTFTLRPLPAGKLVATAVIIQNGREVATTAELLVNGKARGTMPGTFNLPGGTYRLAGKKFGYRQVGGEKKEMVQGGKTTTVVLKFVKD